MNIRSLTVGNRPLVAGRPLVVFETDPAPLFPDMTYLQSGYPTSGRYTYLYWWVPRTNRFITGEHPYFQFAKWGNSSTNTYIIAVKSCSGDASAFSFTGVCKYSQASGQSRDHLTDGTANNYLTLRNQMVNLDWSKKLYYTVLGGSVQNFSSNPFDGNWMHGDEGHCFDMVVESDDIGYIIGNGFNQLSPIRSCDCTAHAYYFTTNVLGSLTVNQTVTINDWQGTELNGNMLHSCQSNFGWWWEV